MKNAIITLNAVGLVVLLCYNFFYNKPPKRGYILNAEVFQAYNASKEAEKELLAMKSAAALKLDSLSAIIDSDETGKTYEIYQYYSTKSEIEQKRFSEENTNKIWVQINEMVQKYGKNEGYEVIFGATGSGGIMYADESINITEDIILFINKNYEDE